MSSNLPSNDNITSSQSLKEILDSSKTGKPHGIQKFVHGILYQVKLFLHFAIFAWGGMKNDEQDFCITSEMPNGGILDDIVVATRDRNGRNTISLFFLQAKHSLDNKPIPYSEIIKDSSPLSFVEFFKSFKLIKANPIYSTYFEKCYLCSNGPLSDALEKMMVQVVDGNEFFLKESGELWKFDKQSPDISQLRDILKKTTDLEILAEKLVDCVINDLAINETNGIFSIYHVALCKERILDKNKFHPDFINDIGLSANAKDFRNKFLEMFTKSETTKEGKWVTDDEALNTLKSTGLRISAQFGKFPVVPSLDIFDADGFAKELHELIEKNLKNLDQIVYNRSQTGRRRKSGKNQIDLLAQFVFVYADNKKTIKFRSSFFDENFVSIIDQLDIPDKKNTKRKLLKFKRSLQTLCNNPNSKVSMELLKQCRFKMGGIYSTVCETVQVRLPSNRETSDEEINDFLDSFYFAVKQPNEETLSELIKGQLSEKYKLSDTSLVSSYLLEKTANWMKDKKSKSLDGQEIQEFMNEGQKQMQYLGIYYETEKFREHLLSYNNDHQIKQLKEFLKNPSKRILWLSTSEPLAIATLIPVTLIATNKSKYCYYDNYILNSLSSMVYSHEEIVSFYEHSSTSRDKPLIIVVDKENEVQANSVIEFAQSIAKLIANGNLGQLIIIAKPSSAFAKQFKQFVTKLEVSFTDYSTKPSLKNIELQGESVTVKEVIGTGTPDLLMDLMTYKRVEIGRDITGKTENKERATYGKGKIKVIEVENVRNVASIIKDKAKMKKRRFKSHWVAVVNLKIVIQKYGKITTSPKELLSSSITKQYRSPLPLNIKLFEHLYDKKQIVLIIDGSKITRYDVRRAKELLRKWKNVARVIWIVMKKTISRQVVPMR